MRDVTEKVGVISPSSSRLRKSTTGVVSVLSASFLAIFLGELCRVADACRRRLKSRLWDLVRGGVGVHRGVGGSLMDTCRAIGLAGRTTLPCLGCELSWVLVVPFTPLRIHRTRSRDGGLSVLGVVVIPSMAASGLGCRCWTVEAVAGLGICSRSSWTRSVL